MRFDGLASQISMGTEISEDDIKHVSELCDQVVSISEYAHSHARTGRPFLRCGRMVACSRRWTQRLPSLTRRQTRCASRAHARRIVPMCFGSEAPYTNAKPTPCGSRTGRTSHTRLADSFAVKLGPCNHSVAHAHASHMPIAAPARTHTHARPRTHTRPRRVTHSGRTPWPHGRQPRGIAV